MTVKHKSDLLITSMITKRIGQHKVLWQILRKKLDNGYNKF